VQTRVLEDKPVEGTPLVAGAAASGTSTTGETKKRTYKKKLP